MIDNSGSTSIDDGKVQQRSPGGGILARGATRWEEIKQLSIQQAEYNVAVGVPAEFHLLNPKNNAATVEGTDFVVVENDGGVAALIRMLSGTRPGGGTPLAERLELIQNRLARRHPWNGDIFLVIVTDGVYVCDKPLTQFASFFISSRTLVGSADSRTYTCIYCQYAPWSTYT